MLAWLGTMEKMTEQQTTPEPVAPTREFDGVIFDLGGVMTEPLFHHRTDVPPEYFSVIAFFLGACGAMADAVRQVREAGYKTALLTNISREGEAIFTKLFPVDELFDVVVDSSKVGMRKPDPEIYRLTCSRLGVAPERCLFIDDLLCNVEAAEALGMVTIQCLDPVAVADEVVRRLLGHPAAAEAGAGA